MKKDLNKKFANQYYDVRSAIYSLLIFTSLLFLLNLKNFNIESGLYFIILVGLFLASLSEYLFSIAAAGKKYHYDHPLRDLYLKIRKHHAYNIILLPVIQYLVCAGIIYYSNDIPLSVAVVFLTSVMSYFTFYLYKDIYHQDLRKNELIEDFFDASRYLSFSFIVYLGITLQTLDQLPKSFLAILLGLIQYIYFISMVWRREVINYKNLAIGLILSILMSGFIYFLLSIFESQRAIIALTITAQIVLWDYVMTSLFVRWTQKKLDYLIVLEYLLVAMIAVFLLFFSK